jgi:hypothetical protein
MLKRGLWCVVTVLLMAGCSMVASTDDKATDPEAVQHYLPNLAGYNATNAKNLTDALSTVTGGASLLTGNFVGSAVIAKLDAMISCYQEVGAIAANVYTPQNIDVTNVEVPTIGAVALINQDRVKNNFLSCVAGNAQRDFSAQAAVEPCVSTGDFKVNQETISYLYAATRPELCGLFEQHFINVKASLPQ